MKQQQQPRSPESDVAEGTGAQRGPFFVSRLRLIRSAGEVEVGHYAGVNCCRTSPPDDEFDNNQANQK